MRGTTGVLDDINGFPDNGCAINELEIPVSTLRIIFEGQQAIVIGNTVLDPLIPVIGGIAVQGSAGAGGIPVFETHLERTGYCLVGNAVLVG